MMSKALLASLALVAFGSLPDGPIIAAWQDWSACNETETLRAVKEGVNVIFWFAISLVKDQSTQQPTITGGPDVECVARVRGAIEQLGLPTSHLITIGGWDAPHPDTSFSGRQWFDVWNEWNNRLPVPFDGFDWDLEGNDDVSSRSNEFTPQCLQLVIDMSVAAKTAGLLATLAPPQSYFDVSTQEFNRFLNNSDPHWHPEFHYMGRNSYGYLFAAAPAGTFDLVEVQLYETFSPALRSLCGGMPGDEYLRLWAAGLLGGWSINITDPLLPLKGLVPVHLEPSRFIAALSFAPGSSAGRSAFFWPEQVQTAYQEADPSSRPRGYAFWNIAMDGSKVNDTSRRVDFARSLNSFLHVRPVRPAEVEDPRPDIQEFVV